MKMILLVLAVSIGLTFSESTEHEQPIERECPCNPSKLWLDVVVAIDSSAGMTGQGMTQVLANIFTVFEETKIAQNEGQHTRLAVVTYGKKATTRYNLTDLKSTDEAMDKIWEITCGNDAYSNLQE
ncbi:unnamed protein product [Strongylus vulgaris]|uniref:VWFA domain-containing protein n=1 Tax=Strongylus vulgaris TaxID=40348 RepID=A0A3P7JNC9_STRVU|nr:unnamed protein product [Strongylus vulgaris]